MNAYLEVKSEIKKSITLNSNAVETTIEVLPDKQVKSEVKSVSDLYKKNIEEEEAQSAPLNAVGKDSIASGISGLLDLGFDVRITDQDIKEFVSRDGFKVSETSASKFVLDTKAIDASIPKYLFKCDLLDRQKYLIQQLNGGGYSFNIPNSGDRMDYDGFKVTSFDETHKAVFITQDKKQDITKPYLQRLCNHFYNNDIMVLVWLASSQTLQ